MILNSNSNSKYFNDRYVNGHSEMKIKYFVKKKTNFESFIQNWFFNTMLTFL